MSGIYVASRASLPARPAMWRGYRDRGFPIISSWIDEAGEGETASLGDLWRRIDREIDAASVLVLYAEREDFPLKGAYIEVGMALARDIPVLCAFPGVLLDPRSARPVGSWLHHPSCQIFITLDAAMSAAWRLAAP